MKSVFTVDQIRRAENRLFALQGDPDELMISAASAVADVALSILESPAPGVSEDDRILLLVGAGGNGGDALYAGAFLSEEGYQVDALLLGQGRVHESALSYFSTLGGALIDQVESHFSYRLVIDGIVGIGGHGGIDPNTARLVENFYSARIPILSIDVPSGVDANTGTLPGAEFVTLDGFDAGAPIAHQKIPTHINADFTITFGGLRRAHAVTTACGNVLIADISVSGGGGMSLSTALRDIEMADNSPRFYASKAWQADGIFSHDSERETAGDRGGIPGVVPGIAPIGQQFINIALEPSAESDKYTGGVVGIFAGSDVYPGAGVLACQGAVRATSSMVRYVGSARDFVIRALPEVVASRTLDSTGKVQAWVFGPGTGTQPHAELADLLSRPEPVLIDADGLSILAASAELQRQLRERSCATVLTPHRGEFERLAKALRSEGVEIPDSAMDPIGAALALACNLDCCVLLKGRFTVVATCDYVYVVDAGHSWSATPGSGDVLSGLVGAHLAQSYAELTRLPDFIPDMDLPATAVYSQIAPAVTIHAVAAALSARTEFGLAPTSASKIAESIPAASAQVNLK